MDGIMLYVLPIIAIATMVVFLVLKLRGTKSNNQTNSERVDTDVNFFIVSVFDRADDGTLEVSGVVENNPIFVGDIFRIVDNDDNIIESNVVVKRIDTGVVKKKYTEEAPVGEVVSLFLKTQSDEIQNEMFLKK